MLKRLLFTISLALLAGCTAASTPNSGGISIPNLVAAPAGHGAGDNSPDYVVVEAWDIDGSGSMEKLLFAGGRARGSIRKAGTSEIVVNLLTPVTRFALIDHTGAKDVVLMNNQAAATERGLTVVDGVKLYNDRILSPRSYGFNGPVYAMAPYGSHYLLATGDAVVEVGSDFVELARYDIHAKDVALIKIKNGGANHQYVFHTEDDCGELPFCLVFYKSDMTSDFTYTTNAQPGRYLSFLPDDNNEDGTVERLFVANGNRTRELKHNGSLSNPEQRLSSGADTAIPSVSLAGRNFYDRSGSYRDLLVTSDTTATLYKQDSYNGNPVPNNFTAVVSWTFPKLRGALARGLFTSTADDIVFMESDRIRTYQIVRDSATSIHFDAKYDFVD